MLVTGTPKYMSPEVIRFIKSGTKMTPGQALAADIWAVGVTLFQFAYGRNLIKSRGDKEHRIHNLHTDILKFNYRKAAAAETERDDQIYGLLNNLFHARGVKRLEHIDRLPDMIRALLK